MHSETSSRTVIGGDLSMVENPILTKSGEERLIEWRNTSADRMTRDRSSARSVPAPTSPNGIRPWRPCERRKSACGSRWNRAGVGIWDMDYATGVAAMVRDLEAQYGLQPGTFGGTFEAFVERIHPDDRESVLETVGKAMASGADFSIQNRSIWPDGTVRWLSGAGRIHLGPDGKPVRGVGISQDVTGRKRAEAELTRLNDEIQLQRLRVFKATMRTVQDIVNNLLNGFQLVRLEAGSQLPAEMLTLIDQMIEEASGKLKALGDLETVNEKEMAVGLGIEYPGSS